MGARADDGLDGADFVPPLLSVYLALGTRLGFYRKLRSHSTRNMAHVDRKRTLHFFVRSQYTAKMYLPLGGDELSFPQKGESQHTLDP